MPEIERTPIHRLTPSMFKDTQDWARVKLGAVNPTQVFRMGDRDPTT